MCGIVGIVDLSGQRRTPSGIVQDMAASLVHRGPDEDGFLEQPGLGLGCRRLSIIGLQDGRQPITNEKQTVIVVYNGELFDYPDLKAALEARGHRFTTHCDTELIPHLWEDHQEAMFEYLRGQFAFALWDTTCQHLILARDRFGICPLFWTRQTTEDGDWFLFASEVKALLASGLVHPRPDVRGIDQVFNFFALPGPLTCFQGIESLLPGQYLRITLDSGFPQVRARFYWEMDFPDHGQEERGEKKKMVDRLEELLLQAVCRRLRADVPVVSYLSGGIDSSLVVAMASKIRGHSIPTYTIQITEPHLDETQAASVVSRHTGSQSFVLPVGDDQVLGNYPSLTRAAEAPVVDTSSAGVLLLARTIHNHGFKVVLTGEGADEWLGGYPWFKVHRLLGYMFPGLAPLLRHCFLRVAGASAEACTHIQRIRNTLGDHSGYQDIYSMMSLNRHRFYSQDMFGTLRDYNPYLGLQPNLGRLRRWHPLNRGLYWGGRIHLPGHLLSLKGDRVAMSSSVEARHPFLDEDVFDFLAHIHPSWKLHGFRNKYLLRLVGERYLPQKTAWRRKKMYRAPLGSFLKDGAPAYVDQLLSEESLKKTGYFDTRAVHQWRQFHHRSRSFFRKRVAELGLVAVFATQLWHHLFIDPSLADLPSGWKPRADGGGLMH